MSSSLKKDTWEQGKDYAREGKVQHGVSRSLLESRKKGGGVEGHSFLWEMVVEKGGASPSLRGYGGVGVGLPGVGVRGDERGT